MAFTLGFVSHQVADVTWHSLGIEQGFLTTMGDVNFFGSFPAAHSVGDPGGDMVVSFEGDTREIPSGINEWYANCVVVRDGCFLPPFISKPKDFFGRGLHTLGPLSKLY